MSEDRGVDGSSAPLEPKGNQRSVIDSTADCISVDAGAGTGKTTTMLMRIEHAIREEGIDPDDVLVLTFANEAAASIREAVTDRLEPEAAAAIDVYTYHSFCYRLVREYAYYLGLSPEFDVVTDHGRQRLVRRLLEENDYDFADATRGDGSAADLTTSVDRFIQGMSQEDVDPATLDERLPDVRTLERLGEFVLWLERQAGEDLSFDNEALRWFNREEHIAEARESLVDYGKLLTYCRECIAEAPAEFRENDVVEDTERYFREMQRCVTNTYETLSIDDPPTKQLPRALFGNEIWGRATDRIEQTPFGRLKHYLEFMRLARHYAAVYADYRSALETERTADFDELVRTATRLLDDPAVADEVTGRWSQVYCDEFQDTDETQFSLITQLTAGADRPSLLAIGDKDQAIYGWRGTDREGLDRLADAYDDHERIALELNFRSNQEILDITNHCDYGPQSSKTLREVDRTPGEYREANPPHRVVKVESSEVGWSTSEQVATTVSRLLNGEFESVPERELADIAVIVRKNSHARAVADELGDLQIPCEVSGSARGEISPGIRTLLSYFRALVDPTADAHLRRVLLYRYRVTEDDLETLHSRAGSLSDAVATVDCDPETSPLTDPDRVEQARDHLETLRELRSVYPLAQFVRRFRELTRLEWFLTSEERTRLERIDRFVEAYDPDTVLGTLTPAFVDALEGSLRGSSTEYGRGSHSADCVDIMTVHQAKGLQFDTVLLPYLSDEEWCVESDYARRARDRLLAAAIDDDVESPLRADLAKETVGEEWRVLHVALTRAENHLFLFGSTYDYEGGDGDGTLPASVAQSCLPEAIEWSVTGERMDLWESLTASFERVRETYPETVVDHTEEIAFSRLSPGTITYYARTRNRHGGDRTVAPLETREAIETVHRLGRLLRTGTLTALGDAVDHADAASDGVELPGGRSTSALTADTVRFPVKTLSNATELPVAMDHSYSSMRTHEECARKHYLDHVVRAVDDPAVAGAGAGSGDRSGDARLVGSLFHDVAEEAFAREYRTRDRWREAARRQLTARGLGDHADRVLACIDRYFDARATDVDAPVHEWETLAAELPFVLEDVPGVSGDVIGYIDSVRRTPTGELVVLDYKATATRTAAGEATQLLLYLRACDDLFDERVSRVGYVYVGEASVDGAAGDDPDPRVDLFTRDQLPDWTAVRETLEAVDEPSFADTSPGDHCRFCPHRSLGCAPAEYAPDRAGDGDGDGLAVEGDVGGDD
ncbi:UvrD-helicase domain-containing protein [Natronoglomus mannanivorans]|uniref:DNA 3'-5' helicase n=1 Tax=Natronoglomus mannanivorans TaxID=2979990 RepID=A0AAP2Z3Y3_9EURY|nr:UvrD-helicase domain-containing protein [Halobacteria archaeon AArc-xg1-1]